MDFKQVIEASATVIRITELKKGNIVKLVDDKDGDAELAFGIVEDVLNDGERGYVQFMTISKRYGSVTIDRRVIGTSSTKIPAVFPATVEEIKTYFDRIERDYERDIETAEKSLNDRRSTLAAFKQTRAIENEVSSAQYVK